MNFEAIADERRRVKELCRRHFLSLWEFKYEVGASFHVLRGEPKPNDDAIIRHLTTTATCIESLRDCHSTFWPQGAFKEFGTSREQTLDGLTRAFYLGALSRQDWVSEGSAPVYCAARALPLFLRNNAEWSEKHTSLVSLIFDQLKDAGRFGIGAKTENPKPPDPKWYPEHAYHTYWALVVLDTVRNRQLPNEANA